MDPGDTGLLYISLPAVMKNSEAFKTADLVRRMYPRGQLSHTTTPNTEDNRRPEAQCFGGDSDA